MTASMYTMIDLLDFKYSMPSTYLEFHNCITDERKQKSLGIVLTDPYIGVQEHEEEDPHSSLTLFRFRLLNIYVHYIQYNIHL